MDYNFEKLRVFSENNLNHAYLSDNQIDQFKELCSLLIEKNKVVNLTAITEPAEIERKHFIDSLMGVNIIKKYANSEEISLIDIGCGAGFPGIPLKIAMPDALFVLTDSISKKIDFVKEVIEVLNLTKISAEAERAEFLARTEYREVFDFAVSRAVAEMPVLLEYCLPFVKVGGHCILYKSSEYQEELSRAEKAIEILGGKVEEVNEFTLPFSTDKRSLIIIKKIKETPAKYPRRVGKAAKSPIV